MPQAAARAVNRRWERSVFVPIAPLLEGLKGALPQRPVVVAEAVEVPLYRCGESVSLHPLAAGTLLTHSPRRPAGAPPQRAEYRAVSTSCFPPVAEASCGRIWVCCLMCDYLARKLLRLSTKVGCEAEVMWGVGGPQRGVWCAQGRKRPPKLAGAGSVSVVAVRCPRAKALFAFTASGLFRRHSLAQRAALTTASPRLSQRCSAAADEAGAAAGAAAARRA